MAMIPVIDMRSLLGEPGMSRDEADSQIAEAAQLFGFFCLTGSADLIPTGHDVREQMLRVFRISDDEQRKLWRCFYAAGQSNVYRGWNPRDGEHGVSIYDLGRMLPIRMSSRQSVSWMIRSSAQRHFRRRKRCRAGERRPLGTTGRWSAWVPSSCARSREVLVCLSCFSTGPSLEESRRCGSCATSLLSRVP